MNTLKDILSQDIIWRRRGRTVCKELGIQRWAGAPKIYEIGYLHALIQHEKPKRILSCGMGCTTKIFNCHGPETLVCVENKPPENEFIVDSLGNDVTNPWRESIEKLEKEIPNLIRYDNWKDVYGTYDFFFLDSSAGINGWEGCRQHHRHDCLCYAMPLLRDGAIVVVHDYNGRINKQAKMILDSPYFSLIHQLGRTGVLKINKRWWLEKEPPCKEVKV